MTQQIKPISAAQTNRIQAMIDRGIFSGTMPSTSWEASWVIRTSAASKRDKDQLKAMGGRVLARMTSSEVEMTSKVLQALTKISAAGSKDESIIEAEILLRQMFCTKAQ
jgi:hypothetical protein